MIRPIRARTACSFRTTPIVPQAFVGKAIATSQSCSVGHRSHSLGVLRHTTDASNRTDVTGGTTMKFKLTIAMVNDTCGKLTQIVALDRWS
jgi:hypothetical protein